MHVQGGINLLQAESAPTGNSLMEDQSEKEAQVEMQQELEDLKARLRNILNRKFPKKKATEVSLLDAAARAAYAKAEKDFESTRSTEQGEMNAKILRLKESIAILSPAAETNTATKEKPQSTVSAKGTFASALQDLHVFDASKVGTKARESNMRTYLRRVLLYLGETLTFDKDLHFAHAMQQHLACYSDTLSLTTKEGKTLTFLEFNGDS